MRRPECPRGKSFAVFECGDPECGPHFVIYDGGEKPLCEMVLSQGDAQALAENLLESVGSKVRRH
ncbi:hypothetical protein V1281_003143 [Nitrobacteraceae bacterium AZCC 2161]